MSDCQYDSCGLNINLGNMKNNNTAQLTMSRNETKIGQRSAEYKIAYNKDDFRTYIQGYFILVKLFTNMLESAWEVKLNGK